VADRAIFLGSLPGAKAVLDFLCTVDLFLNASRQEGLPRALVEALSCGCPAVGTDLAGIPELLPPKCLVPVNDVNALAQRILELLRDPNRMASLAGQSVQTASRYLRSVLDARRKEHYALLRRRTSEYVHP
jgi:glycosyltransferase involved in cell wall biosynthesis